MTRKQIIVMHEGINWVVVSEYEKFPLNDMTHIGKNQPQDIFRYKSLYHIEYTYMA